MQQAQQAQRALSQGAGMQAPQQPNAQRMMRPVMNNALGLRHLLQQVKNIEFQYLKINGI